MNVATFEPATETVLVVDDHSRARESVCDVLRHAGHEVVPCGSAIEALRKVEQTSFDLIITDLCMPGMDGLQFMQELQKRRIESQVIMVTAHGTVAAAVEAMRYGAFDFIEKPFDADQLENLTARALAQSGNGSQRRLSQNGPQMLGDSPAMKSLRKRIANVASTAETVLITGESGTGKELVAQAIHHAGSRAEGPLVSLNCPALSPQLMESELFGHTRGAFTSADASRVGRFELADGGTILLDEVSEIDLPLQAKLLRVLQERSFERVGSSETCQIDVRVIAATNRNLKEEVDAGRFREDLFFRLAVLPLAVPPLREREGDVKQLAEHFLAQTGKRLKRSPRPLSDEALQLLEQYHWPGNVRELENMATRLSVLGDEKEIEAEEVLSCFMEPLEQQSVASSPLVAGTKLHDMERQLIEATLAHFDGHRADTAQALGIGVRTLANKLKAYGYAPRAKSA